MLDFIVAIVIILILVIAAQPRKMKFKSPKYKKKKCKSTSLGKMVNINSRSSEAPLKSIRELSQDTTSRGVRPGTGQPDHVKNMWKSKASQPLVNDLACDIYTPIWLGKYNDYDVSAQHLLSRFGSV
jgi:hypothetical protein